MRQLPISPRLLAVLKLLQLDPAGNELPARGFVFGDAIGGEMGLPEEGMGQSLEECRHSELGVPRPEARRR